VCVVVVVVDFGNIYQSSQAPSLGLPVLSVMYKLMIVRRTNHNIIPIFVH